MIKSRINRDAEGREDKRDEEERNTTDDYQEKIKGRSRGYKLREREKKTHVVIKQ